MAQGNEKARLPATSFSQDFGTRTGGSAWDYDLNRVVVREALELFGFERSMFGSNFPVAGLRIGYFQQVCAITHMIQDCSKNERDLLFHDTAKQFYRL